MNVLAFKQDNLLVWMHTYRILNTSKTTGIYLSIYLSIYLTLYVSTGVIQLISDAASIDDIKKQQVSIYLSI
jgi:hypothetical protein